MTVMETCKRPLDLTELMTRVTGSPLERAQPVLAPRMMLATGVSVAQLMG